MQQRQKPKTFDLGWFLVLVLVTALFACLVVSQELRFQIGGKWSLPLVGTALAITIYLQPPVQVAVRRWREDHRDEAEKRWWREREERERAAHIRTEALREGKIRRERKKKK
jgi:hypothetical protein